MAHRRALVALVALGALVYAGAASAHARLSPPVALAKDGQVFTLAVPTEKQGAATTAIELTVPKGFAIDSFVPTPGWKRTVQQTGSGEEAVIQKVTWTGGNVPTGEDAAFSFLASADHTGSYSFSVRQTYSDGGVVDWSGPESSDTPAPVVKSVSSVGGGGTSVLAIAALAVAAVALVVGIASVLARGGRDVA